MASVCTKFSFGILIKITGSGHIFFACLNPKVNKYYENNSAEDTAVFFFPP